MPQKVKTAKDQTLSKSRTELRVGDPVWRCAYCRGRMARGEMRPVDRDGETVYVHTRHPRPEGEQSPKE